MNSLQVKSCTADSVIQTQLNYSANQHNNTALPVGGTYLGTQKLNDYQNHFAKNQNKINSLESG